MAYKNVFMIRDDEMYQGFVQCKKLGALARVHAENGDVIAAVKMQFSVEANWFSLIFNDPITFRRKEKYCLTALLAPKAICNRVRKK